MDEMGRSVRAKKMIKIICIIIILTACGCKGPESAEPYLCQVVVGNRSDKVLSSVVIDPRGISIELGYLGKGHPSRIAGAGFQRVRFADDFDIAWEEDGVAKQEPVRIAQYESKRNQIKSFSFYYQGNGRWDVVAQDDISRDARTIAP
jgi:hypothetical protein